LLNVLFSSEVAETGVLSRKTSRGKHTTRHTEIFDLTGDAMIYDTPGFTSFDAAGIEPEELQHLYPEIAALYGKCRFKNCTHIKEAGCAVRDAVASKLIHEKRYGSYGEIYKEIIENREY